MGTLLRTYKHGDAVFRVLNVDNINRIIDILVGIKGDGCTIEKPTNAEGRNWKIVFDRNRSDTPIAGEMKDQPKPLNYLVRLIDGSPRYAQYGDFKAYSDFKANAVSNQWLHASGVPFGYCYLTFTPSGGEAGTQRNADSLSSGFSIKADCKDTENIYRLAHGNNHAAMMRDADNNSIQIDVKNYPQAPAYILREWNTDDNYISIPKTAFQSDNNGYDFLNYDTYLRDGETYVDRPAEIKFSSMNRAFFEDLVVEIADITKNTIDENLCVLVFEECLPQAGQFHARCANSNADGKPYVATPGGVGHGGWVALDDIPGLANVAELDALLRDAEAMSSALSSSPWNVEEEMSSAESTLQRIASLEGDLASYASAASSWGAMLDNTITSLQQSAGELTRLEAVATAQEARVEALKQRT